MNTGSDFGFVLLMVVGFLLSLVFLLIWFLVMSYAFFQLFWSIRTGGEKFIEKWANENGWVILHSERRMFFLPWWLTTNSATQKIYRVAVGDPNDGDKIRLAWIRCGDWHWGMKVEKVVVRWDGPWKRISKLDPELTNTPENPMMDRWVDNEV